MVNLTQTQETAINFILEEVDFAALDEIFSTLAETEQEYREIWKYIISLVSTTVNQDGCYEEESVEQYFGSQASRAMIEENLKGWLTMGYQIEYITHYSTKRYNPQYGLYETVWTAPVEM
jgi:hypothetical protein